MVHRHTHTHPHNHESISGIRTAFFLNLTFTVVELVGGMLTNSLAILSDSLHDLGDSLSIGFSWIMENQSHRPSRGRYSYGFRRLSLLAALVNAIVLLTGSLVILSQAVQRLMNPQHSDARGMLLLSLAGIAVNGIAALRVRAGKNMNARVITWHLLEDALGWIAVLIVSISLLFFDIHILDPILSILITLYVLYNVIRNLRLTGAIFLQAAPAEIDMHALEHALGEIPNVLSSHHTHAWSLDGEHHVVTTHLVVPSTATKEDVIQVKKNVFFLLEKVDMLHTTVEIEYEDENCRMKDETHG